MGWFVYVGLGLYIGREGAREMTEAGINHVTVSIVQHVTVSSLDSCL